MKNNIITTIIVLFIGNLIMSLIPNYINFANYDYINWVILIIYQVILLLLAYAYIKCDK